MQYKASLDKSAKIITIFILALFIFISYTSIKSIFFHSNTKNLVVHILVLILLTSVFIGSWILAPKEYTITKSYFIIRKNIGNIRIKRSNIIDVRVLTPNEISGTLRTFGVGGIFGYFGKFYIPDIGSVTFYATKQKNLILITTKDDKMMVISPNDIELLTQLTQFTN